MFDGEVLDSKQLVAQPYVGGVARTFRRNISRHHFIPRRTGPVHPGHPIIVKLVSLQLPETDEGAKNRRYCENQQQSTGELVSCLAQPKNLSFTRL